MGQVEDARKFLSVHGPTLDRHRGFVPAPLLAHWFAAETGCDRLAVSSDRKLIEVGWSQVPLARARELWCDPFDAEGACWIAGYEAILDAARWRAVDSPDPIRRDIGRWLVQSDRNLYYVCELDYSIGTGALRHVLQCTIAHAAANGRGPGDLGLMTEVVEWSVATDLALPLHSRHWGRQTPEQVGSRILKHRDWMREAALVGPIDDPPPGEMPGIARPVGVAPFPAELVPAAKVCARESTAGERQKAWKAVQAYAAARRRREFAPRASLAFRLRKLFERDEVAEPAIRE